MRSTCSHGWKRHVSASTRRRIPTRRSRSCRSSPSSRARSRASCSARSVRPRPRPPRRRRIRMPRPPDQLRALVEVYLDELALTPELGSLAGPMRHALGGKRVRPVLCLATGDAIGVRLESLLPAAAAVELVHSFSLVHDDLPSLDDDSERRGAPSVWAQYDEATAVLAGDALLAEAFRLALSYGTSAVARELVEAPLAMLGGKWLDARGAGAVARVRGRARLALPDRRRHPRRRRLRGRRRRGGRTPPRGRGRGARSDAAGRDRRRHVVAVRDRRRAS